MTLTLHYPADEPIKAWYYITYPRVPSSQCLLNLLLSRSIPTLTGITTDNNVADYQSWEYQGDPPITTPLRWTSDYTPRTPIGAFFSVTRALNDAARAVSGKQPFRRENACKHNNRKGDLFAVPLESSSSLQIAMVKEGEREVTSYVTLPYFCASDPLASYGRVYVYWYGDFVPMQIIDGRVVTYGYEVGYLPKDVALVTFCTGAPQPTSTGYVVNYRETVGANEVSPTSFSFGERVYGGTYGSYGSGADYYTGGVVEEKLSGSIARLVPTGTLGVDAIWAITRTVSTRRYIDGHGSLSNPIIETTSWESTTGCFVGIDPNLEVTRKPISFYKNLIKATDDRFRADVSSWDPPGWGDLLKSALQPTVLSSNHVENLSQLRDIASLIPVPGPTLKSVAGLHLWWKFAFKPTAKDLEEISNVASRLASFCKQKLGKMYTSYATDTLDLTNCKYPTKVRRGVKVVFELAQPSIAIEKYGLSVGAASLWDLVPFSFVIDWFLGVQSVLAQADMILQQGRYNLYYWLNSLRFESAVAGTDMHETLRGLAYLIDYRRGGSNIWPSLIPTFQGLDPVQYWVTGTALATAILL